MLRLPQTQRLRHAVTVAKHRQIPGFAGNGERRFPEALLRHFPANANLHVQLRVMAEPRVGIAMPVVRRFHLMAVSEGLTEQAVLVVQTVTNRRLADGRHGIQETGRQTTQATVAQRRVNLFFQQIGQVNVVFFKNVTNLLIPAEVQQVVARQTANQELH